MDRRTFVLLTGAASTATLRPARAVGRAGRRTVGRLRFELDDHRRWSLWYYGDGSPVPIVRTAEVVAWVGDRPLTLAELEDSTVGNRRPPGGDAVVVRGRAAGVWIEVEFLSMGSDTLPQAAVTITLFPDRYLPTAKGVRFFQFPPDEALSGEGSLSAVVNGLHSGAPCQVVTVGSPQTAGMTSYGALGLSRAGSGLALAFDPGDPGEGRFHLAADRLEAVSDWLPARPLRPEGDAARLSLCFAPTGDGLDALRAAFIPSSPVDRERLARAVAPAGWCSRSQLSGTVTENDVIANAEFCAAHFDRRFFRDIELDDGYERAAGDWEPNERFPHGHAWLSDQIHSKGFKAGLWLAPFAAAEGSGLPAAHADWLLHDEGGPVVCATRDAWGGKVFALDGAHPKVQQWLYDLARRVVGEWGYDYLRVDLLRWATVGTAHYGGLTHAEAYRAGLAAIRDGLGTEALLLAGGAPLQHSIGLVNAMRIGPDVDASWAAIQPPARAAGLRSFYHRSTWLNDPDCLVVRPPLPRAAAELWASLVAVTGGLTLLSDDMPKLPPDRVPLLQRAVPAAPVVGRPIEAAAVEQEVAPALVAERDVYRLDGPWRFRTGDDPAYGSREFDEAAWETIPVGRRWDDVGHQGYVGLAWYRTRFSLPARSDGGAGRQDVVLELGKIGDADEAFLNGTRVGQTGDIGAGRGDPEAYRRYRVPPEALNWGGENALAVRVLGGGGIWSLRRDRPPHVWVTEGAPRWWTATIVNWEDEPHEVSLPLSVLDIHGTAFDVYDVWNDMPGAGIKDVLAVSVDARSARTVAIRPAAARPQVIGTTRHVVQGAVDVTDETWDAAARLLKARSTNLDARPYAVTIAVPKGMRPGACKADVPCTITRVESGHAVLQWPGGDGRDITWELTFRSAPRR
jgi:melibiase-like protein